MADPKIRIVGQFDDGDIRAKLDELAKALERVGQSAPTDTAAADALEETGKAAEDAAVQVDKAAVALEDVAPAGVEAGRGAEKAKKEIREAGKESDKAGGQFAGLSKRLLGLAAAFLSIQGARRAIDAARAQEISERRVGVALGDNIKALEEILRITEEIRSQSTFRQDELNEAAAVLLSAGVSARELRDVLQVVADTAAQTGVSLVQVARGVGLFGQGSAGELGERVTELRELAREGRLAGEGLDVLRAKFGGAAAQIADSDIGRIDRASTSLVKSLGQIGDVLAGLADGPFEQFAQAIERAARALEVTFGTRLSGLERFDAVVERFGTALRTARGDVGQLRRDLEELQQLFSVTGDSANDDRLGMFRFQREEIQRMLDALRLINDTAEDVDLGSIVVTGTDPSAEIERLTALLAELQAQVGQSAPTIRSLRDEFQGLAQAVGEGNITQEQASAQFAAAVEARRAGIARAIADLEALKAKEAELTDEIDAQIASLVQLNAALNEVAAGGFQAIAAQQAPATTAMEAFDQTFSSIVENAGSFTNLGADLASTLANGISGLVAVFASADASFSQFARNFVRQILTMIAQTLIFRAIAGALAGGGGGFTSSGGAAPSSLTQGPPASLAGGYEGGLFTAGAGMVPGADVGYDNVNAKLAGGEYVIPSHIVRAVGPQFFHAVRAGAIPASLLRSMSQGAGSVANVPRSSNYGGGMTGNLRSSGGIGSAMLVADGQTADRLFNGDGRNTVARNVQRIQRDTQ